MVQEERVRQGDFVQFRERAAKLKGLSFKGKNIEKKQKSVCPSIDKKVSQEFLHTSVIISLLYNFGT